MGKKSASVDYSDVPSAHECYKQFPHSILSAGPGFVPVMGIAGAHKKEYASPFPPPAIALDTAVFNCKMLFFILMRLLSVQTSLGAFFNFTKL